MKLPGFARNVLIAREQHILSLYVVIAVMSVIIGYQAYLNASQINRITLYYPPDLSSGYTQTVGDVPPPVVYMFASTVMRTVNDWPDDGAKDAQEKLRVWGGYMSPDFRQQLMQIVEEKIQRGVEIVKRRREMTEIPGKGFVDGVSVKSYGDSWVVYLNVTIKEWAVATSAQIRDEQVQYALIVQRGRLATENNINPYGLYIVGYERPPITLSSVGQPEM